MCFSTMLVNTSKCVFQQNELKCNLKYKMFNLTLQNSLFLKSVLKCAKNCHECVLSLNTQVYFISLIFHYLQIHFFYYIFKTLK